MIAEASVEAELRAAELEEIPIIDVAPLIDGSDVTGIAHQIGRACREVGFFYIVNHGFDPRLVSQTYRRAREFFELPVGEKEKLSIVHSGLTLRGYIPFFGENVDPNHTRDLKECFDLGCHETEVSPFFGPNLMPEALPGFKTTVERYHDAMLLLAKELIAAIAVSLELPADYFERLQRKPITIQRLQHFPPQEGTITKDEMGIGAHTDYGFLTILSQDSVGGLQVKSRDGRWVNAPPIEGSLIINIGDLVQTFTNDRYMSTLHRVVNTSGIKRYSIPFFIGLDFDAEVSVVPTCQSESNPARYLAYTCGEHKYGRFVDSYAHLQTL